MGTTSSKNVSDSMMEVSTQVLTKVIQDCSSAMSATQVIDLTGCRDVTLKNIDFNQVVSVDTSCIQNTYTDTAISTDMEQATKQQAETIKQAFSMNPASAEAINITRLAQNLSTSVVNEYRQNCRRAISALQEMNLNDCSDIVLKGVKFTQKVSDATNCAMSSDTVVAVQNELRQSVDQSAKVKEENMWSWLVNLIVVVVIGVVVVAVVVGIAKVASEAGNKGGGGGPNINFTVPGFPPGAGAGAGAASPSTAALAGGAAATPAQLKSELDGFVAGAVVGGAVLAVSSLFIVDYMVLKLGKIGVWPYHKPLPTAKLDDDAGAGAYTANVVNHDRNDKINKTNNGILYGSLAGVVAGAVVVASVGAAHKSKVKAGAGVNSYKTLVA
jgi:hypothetical protein